MNEELLKILRNERLMQIIVGGVTRSLFNADIMEDYVSRALGAGNLSLETCASVSHAILRASYKWAITIRTSAANPQPKDEKDWFRLLPTGPENEPCKSMMTIQSVMEQGDQVPVWALLTAWLRDSATRRGLSEESITGYTRFLSSFCLIFGHLAAGDIRQSHLDDWGKVMLKQEQKDPQTGYIWKWGRSTRQQAVGTVKAAFAWAKMSGVITENYFDGEEE